MSQDRTAYQEKIIKRYYENREDLMYQKLAELATDLYLAEGKKRQQLWKRAEAALKNLKVEQIKIDRLIAADNPSQLVVLLEKKK
ncbi:MAG: hypothetical protein LBN39_08645 [Planctomycetaceae bacterium]|jgi:hypothetical protein|nr:hypothetical protein [Planctomycetaceae bacterium]